MVYRQHKRCEYCSLRQLSACMNRSFFLVCFGFSFSLYIKWILKERNLIAVRLSRFFDFDDYTFNA